MLYAKFSFNSATSRQSLRIRSHPEPRAIRKLTSILMLSLLDSFTWQEMKISMRLLTKCQSKKQILIETRKIKKNWHLCRALKANKTDIGKPTSRTQEKKEKNDRWQMDDACANLLKTTICPYIAQCCRGGPMFVHSMRVLGKRNCFKVSVCAVNWTRVCSLMWLKLGDKANRLAEIEAFVN